MDKGEIIARLAELADNEFICWKLLEKHGLAGSDEVEILFTEEYVDYISKEEAMQASLPEHRNTLLARCRAIDKERRSCPAIARALKDKYIPCTLLSDNIEAYKLILRRRNYYVPACHLSRLFSGVGHRVLYDLLRQQQIKKSDFISMEKIENIKRSLSGAVTVQEAALDLHVTTRTVYRKAKELGITIKSFGMSADEFGKLSADCSLQH
jgi:hypothetical protein